MGGRGTSVAAAPQRNLGACGPAQRLRESPASTARVGEPAEWQEEVSVAKEDRGFASMDRQKQREIASKGGKAAHQKGTAHEWTSEEAREAGRKGGMASHRRRKEMTDVSTSDDMGQGSGPGGMSNRPDDQSEQIR